MERRIILCFIGLFLSFYWTGSVAANSSNTSTTVLTITERTTVLTTTQPVTHNTTQNTSINNVIGSTVQVAISANDTTPSVPDSNTVKFINDSSTSAVTQSTGLANTSAPSNGSTSLLTTNHTTLVQSTNPTTTATRTTGITVKSTPPSADSTTPKSATTPQPAASTKAPNTGAVKTTVVKSTESTTSSNTDTDGQIDSQKECKETAFGKIGLFALVGLSILCFVLLLVLILMVIKLNRRKQMKIQQPEEKEAVPKLKMLEIKETPLKTYSKAAGVDDGLQTFSLDYEKYVQQKKEEHKKKVSTPSSNDPDGPAVSSFLIGKKPLVMEKNSNSPTGSPKSPQSPNILNNPGGTPAEQKPLLDEDEPVVFKFTKTPGESLAARRASKPESEETRRGSTGGSFGKPIKGLELSSDNFTLNL